MLVSDEWVSVSLQSVSVSVPVSDSVSVSVSEISELMSILYSYVTLFLSFLSFCHLGITGSKYVLAGNTMERSDIAG